jgi:hypothetical protein
MAALGMWKGDAPLAGHLLFLPNLEVPDGIVCEIWLISAQPLL